MKGWRIKMQSLRILLFIFPYVDDLIKQTFACWHTQVPHPATVDFKIEWTLQFSLERHENLLSTTRIHRYFGPILLQAFRRQLCWRTFTIVYVCIMLNQNVSNLSELFLGKKIANKENNYKLGTFYWTI